MRVRVRYLRKLAAVVVAVSTVLLSGLSSMPLPSNERQPEREESPTTVLYPFSIPWCEGTKNLVQTVMEMVQKGNTSQLLNHLDLALQEGVLNQKTLPYILMILSGKPNSYVTKKMPKSVAGRIDMEKEHLELLNRINASIDLNTTTDTISSNLDNMHLDSEAQEEQTSPNEYVYLVALKQEPFSYIIEKMQDFCSVCKRYGSLMVGEEGWLRFRWLASLAFNENACYAFECLLKIANSENVLNSWEQLARDPTTGLTPFRHWTTSLIQKIQHRTIEDDSVTVFLIRFFQAFPQLVDVRAPEFARFAAMGTGALVKEEDDMTFIFVRICLLQYMFHPEDPFAKKAAFDYLNRPDLWKDNSWWARTLGGMGFFLNVSGCSEGILDPKRRPQYIERGTFLINTMRNAMGETAFLKLILSLIQMYAIDIGNAYVFLFELLVGSGVLLEPWAEPHLQEITKAALRSTSVVYLTLLLRWEPTLLDRIHYSEYTNVSATTAVIIDAIAQPDVSNLLRRSEVANPCGAVQDQKIKWLPPSLFVTHPRCFKNVSFMDITRILLHLLFRFPFHHVAGRNLSSISISNIANERMSVAQEWMNILIKGVQTTLEQYCGGQSRYLFLPLTSEEVGELYMTDLSVPENCRGIRDGSPSEGGETACA